MHFPRGWQAPTLTMRTSTMLEPGTSEERGPAHPWSAMREPGGWGGDSGFRIPHSEFRIRKALRKLRHYIGFSRSTLSSTA